MNIVNGKYPVIGTKPQEYIPHEILIPHEEQAIYNHGQTLKRLAERGGYSRNGDYSREGNYSNDYDNGNSYRRGRSATTGRYVHRPNYSRLSGDDTDMDEYRSRKREYSNSRDDMTKNKMLDALEDFMSGVCGMLKQIYRDSDVAEERQIIRKYAREIAEM